MCERWVGDWTDCNILTLSSSDYSSTSFSFCSAAQPGVLRAQALCWELVFTASNCNSNKLTPSNSNCLWHRVISFLTTTYFSWASQLHRIQPVHGQGYILISSTGCTCFLINGWVRGQYVTYTYIYKSQSHLIILHLSSLMYINPRCICHSLFVLPKLASVGTKSTWEKHCALLNSGIIRLIRRFNRANIR